MKASIQEPINKEAIRMMIADIGYQETAAKTGIKYGTLRNWASIGKWFKPIQHHSQALTTLTKPVSELHAEALADYKRRSTTALAKYSAEAAEEASSSKSKLNISRKAKDVADIHKTIWPQEQNQQNILNLAVLVNPPARDGTETLEDAPELLADAKVIQNQPEQS